MLNGAGFTYDRIGHLWLVDVATGAASRLTDGRGRRSRAGLVARRPADRVQLEPPARRRHPARRAWTSTSSTCATRVGDRGHPRPALDVLRARPGCPTAGRSRRSAIGWTGGAGSRNDIWLFAADGSDATPTGGRNLSAAHDLMPGSGMSSDVTRGEAPRARSRRRAAAGSTFSAPIDGAYELWRIARRRRPARAADRRPPLRLGLGRRPGGPRSRRGGTRIAYLRSTADRAARRVAPRRRRLVAGREAAPAHRVQRGRPRRARAP